MLEPCLLIYSGGLDSTVMLAWLISKGYKPTPMRFDYGSTHSAQEERAVCRALGFYVNMGKIEPLFQSSISAMKDFKSALLRSSDNIPEGHYHEEDMRKTVVPFRNGIMIALAVGLAVSRGIGEVYIATHAGDHYIYPDCRPDFNANMSYAVRAGTGDEVQIHFPFQDYTKADIVGLGLALLVPFQYTWTCYKGGEKPCGKCGSCRERLEAFEINGAVDPLEYEEA